MPATRSQVRSGARLYSTIAIEPPSRRRKVTTTDTPQVVANRKRARDDALSTEPAAPTPRAIPDTDALLSRQRGHLPRVAVSRLAKRNSCANAQIAAGHITKTQMSSGADCSTPCVQPKCVQPHSARAVATPAKTAGEGTRSSLVWPPPADTLSSAVSAQLGRIVAHFGLPPAEALAHFEERPAINLSEMLSVLHGSGQAVAEPEQTVEAAAGPQRLAPGEAAAPGLGLVSWVERMRRKKGLRGDTASTDAHSKSLRQSPCEGWGGTC